MAWRRLKSPTVMRFETRLNLHWLFVPMSLVLFFHHQRTFYVLLAFSLAWFVDYAYVYLCQTYRLDFVEYTRLDDGGVQILWRNPPGFRPRAGEYVKILVPWLHSHTSQGIASHSDEWHAFSLYMAEKTGEGLQICKQAAATTEAATAAARRRSQRLSMRRSVHGSAWADAEEDTDDLDAEEYSALVRRGGHSYETTQIFVMPVGDWSKALSEAVETDENVTRSCWVRGPYTSPYHVSTNFSKIILVASGIGITPALGVLSQYEGDRECIVVWMLRSKEMLLFFAPLLRGASKVIVHYTNKRVRLSDDEIALLVKRCPLISVQQCRPKLDTLIPELMRMSRRAGSWCKMRRRGSVNVPSSRTMATKFAALVGVQSSQGAATTAGSEGNLGGITEQERAAWCALYCGGSRFIKEKLAASARALRIGWEAELFDW